MIDANSIASGARAFQLMLALQDLGQIQHMTPDQAAIENGTATHLFSADVTTELPQAEVYRALNHISEIEQVVVDGQVFGVEPPTAQAPANAARPDQSVGAGQELLGDYLVRHGLLTPENLARALAEQTSDVGNNLLFGQRLVKLGLISQPQLDRAVAQQIQELRTALQTAASAPERTKARGPDRTVRTSVERLDNLMNLVGELITDRNRLYQVRSDFELTHQGSEQVEHLAQVALHMGRITDQLQEEVMRIRMLPIGSVSTSFRGWCATWRARPAKKWTWSSGVKTPSSTEP